MKSGFVSLVGRPNVGKSTLLNTIIGEKIAITSSKVGTTRNIIQGIYNDSESQIIFVDTPGINKPLNKLGRYLNNKAYYMTDEVDTILFLVDASTPPGAKDQAIIDNIKNKDIPIILILNKIDKIPKLDILKRIDEYKDLYSFAEIIPLSAMKNDNVDRLITVIRKYLTDDVKYYEDDVITNVSKTFMISEIIREKILRLTDKEVPHSVTVNVESIEEDNNVVHIGAVIIVDRDNLKSIIIGKKGTMLTAIGKNARLELEAMLNKKVYLNFTVKTFKNWRDKENYLSEFGLKEIE